MGTKNKHQLNSKEFTSEFLRKAYNKQIEKKEWSFYDERKHVEELLCQRFNYLIVAFSLFVTAFASINGRINKLIILFTGFVILTLISLTIRRAYLKLDINLKILYKLQNADDPEANWNDNCYNAMSIIDKEIKTRPLPLKNMNKTIGLWIPLAFISIFGIGIITICLNIWKLDSSSTNTTKQTSISISKSSTSDYNNASHFKYPTNNDELPSIKTKEINGTSKNR